MLYLVAGTFYCVIASKNLADHMFATGKCAERGKSKAPRKPAAVHTGPWLYLFTCCGVL